MGISACGWAPDEESTPITSCVTDPSLRSQESLHSKFNSVGTNYVLIIFYVGSVVLGPGDAERRRGPGPSGASKADGLLEGHQGDLGGAWWAVSMPREGCLGVVPEAQEVGLGRMRAGDTPVLLLPAQGLVESRCSEDLL